MYAPRAQFSGENPETKRHKAILAGEGQSGGTGPGRLALRVAAWTTAVFNSDYKQEHKWTPFKDCVAGRVSYQGTGAI